MQIKFFCPRWGCEHLSWDEFCEKAKSVGYDGIEAGVSFEKKDKEEMKTALQKHNLLFIGQYFQSFESNFEEHFHNYKKWLYNIAELNPILIDSQTGKDYFSEDENEKLFSVATEFTNETKITVAHETHRNKALYAAHITKKILAKYKDLKITADFSHWCCVAESLLEDQQEAVAIGCERAIHIHARVGYTQAAQVNDPRAMEWKKEVNTFLNWWDTIVENRKKDGTKLLTITPEFGPEPYMPVMPHTLKPLANQWDINVFMMELLRKKLI